MGVGLGVGMGWGVGVGVRGMGVGMAVEDGLQTFKGPEYGGKKRGKKVYMLLDYPHNVFS